ncbi:MAG: T9SS type A sorting domain-containing protein [Saprospiraceae bacterium]|nr:T9SS type A sorting domain-containing protein [Saprospiraceae bacterium]
MSATTYRAGAQCSPDTEAPTVACVPNIDILINPGQTDTLFAYQINAMSTDNCDAPDQLQLRIERQPFSGSLPTATFLVFDESDVGVHIVSLWVTDQAGNSNQCWSMVTVLPGDCINPLFFPVCIDSVTVVIPAGETVEIYPWELLADGNQCPGISLSLDQSPIQLPYLSLNASLAGTHTVQVTNTANGVSCWVYLTVNPGNCSGDTEPPIAVCDAFITAQLGLHGPDLTYIEAQQLNEGSTDNCTGNEQLRFAIEGAAMPSATMPSATSLAFTALGTYPTVWLWVADEAGNTNVCFTEVTIVEPQCSPDLTPPVCTAPADTTIAGEDWLALLINPFDYPALNVHFGAATGWDACGLDTILQTSFVTYNLCNAMLSIRRSFVAVDAAGNTSEPAVQMIHIRYTYFINIPQDYLPGDVVLEELTLTQTDGLVIGVAYNDEAFDFNCDSIPDLIRRTWLLADWCRVDISPQDPPVIELPRLDRNGDGVPGDGYAISTQMDDLYLLENGEPGQLIGPNTGFFSYTQVIRYNYNDTTTLAVAGQVFHDVTDNCSADPIDPPLAGWRVIATGQSTGRTYSALSNANGLYEILGICPEDTELELRLDVPFNYGQSCPTTWTVNVPLGMPAVQNIPVQLEAECPLMRADLTAPFLRRCFPNTYTVSYCNYSNQTIEDVQVEVLLDPLMEFSGSEIPATDLGNNVFSFSIGNLEAGACGNFSIDFLLSCDAELGQTHCSTARILPDTLCPQLSEWSGANIEVEGFCEGDSVYLLIKNTGPGNMTEPLHFIVVEDVIMYMQDEFQINSGQIHPLPPIPAGGQTWRLEAEQVPAHPYPGNVAVAVEGCNGINMTGLVNIFPMENPNPFIAVDCQENIGSFDPNDKTAAPAGYGQEHFIRPDTEIEYLIRFQNTGTDTAFRVVILDTLSQWLNPKSVRPGAASHPFNFEILHGEVLRFTFDNILLPDSTTNEPASQGFVKFSVKQEPNLNEGTRIENTASIYFDFNEPIHTNTVFHTIGNDFIRVVSDTRNNPAGLGPLKVFPNPAAEDVTFLLPPDAPDAAAFLLYDRLGRVVSQGAFQGGTFRFQRGAFASGVYFYRIEMNGRMLYSGKVLLY